MQKRNCGRGSCHEKGNVISPVTPPPGGGVTGEITFGNMHPERVCLCRAERQKVSPFRFPGGRL